MMRNGFGTGGYGMMGGVGGFFMALFMLLLFTLVILGIMALMRYLHVGHKSSVALDATVQNILNERYARGEINDEEYTAKKALLNKRT